MTPMDLLTVETLLIAGYPEHGVPPAHHLVVQRVRALEDAIRKIATTAALGQPQELRRAIDAAAELV